MEVRLNKLMSDYGLCSRREADKFIEMGRVTVNGKQPVIGQKVTENDIVLVDGEQIRMGKHSNAGKIRAMTPKAENLIYGPKAERQKQKPASKAKYATNNQPAPAQEEENKKSRREHYAKYNKYAAARRAAKEHEAQGGKSQPDKKTVYQEATQPKFGRSLSRSAVAQRIAASPKSAALRKTSRNNPLNKAKRKARNA